MLRQRAPANEALIEALEAGYALPSSWYTDARHHARECELILRRSWHFGGHTGQLPEVGDRFLCEVGGVPIVLLRDERRNIRGFVNICRHRAHPVVHDPESRRTLQCLYHGWTYTLDGCLLRAPRAEAELDFDKSQFGLIPVQVAVWGPTIWVNVDCEAPSFASWAGGLAELVESHGVDVTRHVYTLEREWTIRANWKVFVDNAIECYHCPTCHPALSRVIETDPDLHTTTTAGPYRISSETPFRDGVWQTYYGIDPPPGEAPRYHFHWIFPTTYFQYKGGSDFEIGTVEVRGVDEIRFRHLVFMPPDVAADVLARREKSIATDPTVDEDVAICERVQRSHRADAVPPGRLLPRSEEALLHFQRTILEMMAASAAA